MRLRSFSAFALGCLVCVFPLYSFAEQAKDSQENPSAIVVNVNRVLIPVVVRDKQGQAVGDLKKEDFRVFDNDKPRTISGFTIEKREGNESRTEASTGSGQQPASIPSRPPEQSATASQRFIVFLFDDVHSSADELANAKKAGGKMLAGTLGDSDVAAVVSLSEQTNSGLISDRTRLQEAVMSLKKYTGSQAEVAVRLSAHRLLPGLPDGEYARQRSLAGRGAAGSRL